MSLLSYCTVQATNDKDVMRNFGLGSMEYISEKHKKISAEIMETMPDSPSMSNLSSMQTPVNETLILSSENNLDFTKFKNRNKSLHVAKSSNNNAGTRDSREHIEYNDYESKQHNEENTVKYSDPSPLHPSKKYDGYVGKAITRMDSDGVLPTPSKSESKNYSFGYDIEKQHSEEQFKYAVTQLSNLKADNSRRTKQSKIAMPLEPPTNTLNNVSRDDMTENDEDDDLKQFEMDIVAQTGALNIGGLPPPNNIGVDDDDAEYYENTQKDRGRGLSNSSSSGANSLNSNGSPMVAVAKEKKTKKGKSKKKKTKTKILTKKKKRYDPVEPVNSISSSHAETDIDIKKDDVEEKKVKKVKKKKKNKAPKNPKIKSPFFASDAAVTKSKKKTKSEKKSVSKVKSTKSSKGLKAKKKSKSKMDK